MKSAIDTSTVLLGQAQLRALVPLDLDAIEQVEATFRSLATEAVAMPPILRLDVPEHNGEVDVKIAYLPRFSSFAIKVSPVFSTILRWVCRVSTDSCSCCRRAPV